MPSLKTFALPLLPPHLGDAWPQALDAWRGPSPSQELRKLVEGMREGVDLNKASDSLGHARAPARPPPAPATTRTRRGAPRIHDWDTIKRIDAEFCRDLE